jgi:hypothetical protein
MPDIDQIPSSDDSLSDEDAPVGQPRGETQGSGGESEFRLTVRKLQLPVRPRGVLAE